MLVIRRVHSPLQSLDEPPSGGASPGAVPPGLDAQAIARLRELDPTGQARLVERVIDAYLGSADRLAQQLREALANGDAAAIRMVAHTLKSSSASVGALALSRQCAQTEAMVREQGVVPALDASIQQLLQHLDTALVDLRSLRAGPMA